MGRFYPHSKVIYLPTPSWGNHTPIFRDSGLEVRQYRYFDKKTVGLDFAGLKEDLEVWSTIRQKGMTCDTENGTPRMPQHKASSFSMPVPIIPPVLTQLSSSGRKFLTSSERSNFSHSLTWHTKDLLPATLLETPSLFVTLLSKVIRSHYRSRSRRTWVYMGSVSGHFNW